MTIENLRAQMIASVWQAVAQSGVDLSGLPQAQQETLVSKIADTMLVTMNRILEEQIAAAQAAAQPDTAEPAPAAVRAAAPETAPAVPPAAQPDPLAATIATANGEQVLWEGRPFLSLVEKYQITNQRLRITHGLLSRDIENVELIRIQDMDLKQAVGERMLDVGDIALKGVDSSKPNIVLRNVTSPNEVFEILRKAWLEARKSYGVQLRDYMAPPNL